MPKPAHPLACRVLEPVVNAPFKVLDRRRRESGLSYELLAQRCGPSRPTVYRILSGRHESASFASVAAIAESLGLEIRSDSRVDPRTLRRDQSERKAKPLVALVQGMSGLEGQAVDCQAIAAMVERPTKAMNGVDGTPSAVPPGSAD